MTKRWVVTIDPGQSPADIGDRLRAEGFSVDQMLSEIGIVIGDADDAAAERVRLLDAVKDVSPEHAIDIGGPGTDPTW